MHMKPEFDYTKWYFGNFATEGFSDSYEFLLVVGKRPSVNFSLTRTNVKNRKAVGEPLTKDNFVWTTKAAIAKAKEGRYAPPIFPAETRTPQQQALNDERFLTLAKPIIDYALRQQARRAKIQQWESDLAVLLDNITQYVLARGYEAHDAMNPEVLPEDKYPKLNAARRASQRLMRMIDNPDYEHQPKRLKQAHATRAAKRQAIQMAKDPVAVANRLYNGKVGRPLNKLITVKKRISELTPEQKAKLGIPLHQDYYTIDKPQRKNQKVWTVAVTVPNPKLTPEAPETTEQQAA
jgi:hypothetical protein